mmetsp:Transcript_2643/g.2475  ORF Transcript_2643/g.2475 Transcript_2643/m.2475 type:complete len:83 (+) Transcript_2643:783-1031(+)
MIHSSSRTRIHEPQGLDSPTQNNSQGLNGANKPAGLPPNPALLHKRQKSRDITEMNSQEVQSMNPSQNFKFPPPTMSMSSGK